MVDEITEVSEQGLFGRLGAAFKGIVFGGILAVICVGALWWNEGRAVDRYKALAEGRGNVVSTSADTVDSALDGKLVHLTGATSVSGPAVDKDFDVQAEALALRRTVDMYQWVEDKDTKTVKKLGGGTTTETTYSYKKKWDDSHHNSSNFKKSSGHENPSFPIRGTTSTGSEPKLSAYGIDDLASRIQGSTPLQIEELSETAKAKGYVLTGNYLFKGKDFSNPTVGDVRVSFTTVPVGTVSMVATQKGSDLIPAKSSSGDDITLVQNGTHTADQMFTKAESDNATMTWIIRGVGFLVMAIGLRMLFGPLEVIGDIVPFIGDLIRVGTTLIAGIMAAVVSLITISLSWLFYRPMIGVPLLVVAVGLIVFMFIKKKSAPRTA